MSDPNKGLYSYILLYFLLFSISFILVMFSANFLFPFSGDYSNYITEFTSGGSGRFELGYKLVTLFYAIIVERSEPAYIFLWAIFAFLTVNIKLYAAYLINKNTIFSFFICYVAYVFLLHETNQIRVSIALSFCLISLYFVFNDRQRIAIFLIVLGCFFHYSMALFFIIYIVKYFLDRLLYKEFFIFSSLLFLIIYIGFEPSILGRINPLMMVYSSASLHYSFNIYYIFVLTGIIFIGLFRLKKMTKESQYLFLYYFILFFIALALTNFPIIAVRIMDIATIIAIYFVHSNNLKFNRSFEDLFTILMYMLVYVLCFARSYVFFTTDTIYRFH